MTHTHTLTPFEPLAQPPASVKTKEQPAGKGKDCYGQKHNSLLKYSDGPVVLMRAEISETVLTTSVIGVDLVV